MTASPSIFTDHPDLTAALRHLTWAYAADGRAFTWQEIVTQINVARAEMGLGALHKGAPITLLQKRSLGSPQRDPLLPAHYEKVGRGQHVPVVPGTNWRFTAGHTHGEIRAVARDALRPAAAPGEDPRLVARGTHLPDVRWTPLTPGAADLARLDGQPGLYLVRYPNHSDVGQTDEVQAPLASASERRRGRRCVRVHRRAGPQP
ncbi:hypothetical protein LAJ19_14905 (plasmid) [Deinococcus taeanensis]|uniref:hypothetical protein n=1 Tax=Deinococcus taeanensis TaxID=2737050 RepID=UPI001CDBFADC|nr:hypothetical protein [Deinococcus taeanensis]UBV44098.1 hypothetical protein LAJ19_14905 [Deinococcus taeanensis]